MRIAFNKKYAIIQPLVLVLLFLASMNAFSKYFYFIFIAFVVLLFKENLKLKADRMFFLLLSFSALFVVFSPDTSGSLMLSLKQFAYPLCYLIGLNFQTRRDRNNAFSAEVQNKVYFAISLMALGAFAHYCLNFLINIDSLARNNVDFWSGEILNSTGQAALSIMAVAVFVSTIFSQARFSSKIYSIIGLAIVFIYNFILAGRSLIVITLSTMLAAIIFMILSTDTRYKAGKILLIIISFVLIFVIYSENIFGLRDFIFGTNLSKRLEQMSFFEDIRLIRKGQYISNMFMYPFGGGKLHDFIGGHAHDILLDTYSDAGMFAFLVLLGFFAVSLKNAFNIIRNKRLEYNLRILVLCMFVVLILEFSIEPILAGMPWMFCAFCFYCGLLKVYGKKHQ